MLILRIRQAEVAIADGRLDAAYELAIRPDVNQHRRGQRVIKNLVERLVKRSQQHLDGQRFQQAWQDCDRAARLAGNQPAVVKLRSDVKLAEDDYRARQRKQKEVLATAQRQLQLGELSVAGNLCSELEDSSVAGQLNRELQQRRESVQNGLQRARHAVELNQHDDAIRELLHVNSLQPKNSESQQLSAEVVSQLVQEIQNHLVAGRLDQARAILDRVAELAQNTIAVENAGRILAACESAAAQVQHGKLSLAAQSLKRIKQLLPQATWVDEAIASASSAAAASDSLKAGPLGLLEFAYSSTNPVNSAPTPGQFLSTAAGRRSPEDLELGSDRRFSTSELPFRFLLHVDAGGSFLVLRQSPISFGPISSSRSGDVVRLASASAAHFSIERLDGDYFFRADQPVQINGRPETSKLLNDGDRITLGPRATIKFGLPHAASSSAVLDLVGTSLAKSSVRRLLLMDSTLLLAPFKASHVQVRPLSQSYVLFLRHNQLFARKLEDIQGQPQSISPGSPLELDGVHIAVKSVDA